jgi:uncharacterized protein YgiM (DUF1202 family)
VVPAETKPSAPVKKTVKARKKIVKKAKAVARPAVILAPVTLVAGPATVAAAHVNLRGQAGLKGEVVGHVQKGDAVTVISEITLDKPKAGEPAQWAKIALPGGTKVWVNSKFIDATNNLVVAKKLNLRGGPGENYSVIGVLEKGAGFTQVTSKGDWTQIETPASAFAFVAASYLKQEVPLIDTNVSVTQVVAAVEPVTPTPAVVPEPAPVPPTPTTVLEPSPVAAASTTVPPSDMSMPAPGTTPTQLPPNVTVPSAPPAPVVETNLGPVPPRVVTHEGKVRASVSLVAPTAYELFDPTTDKAINYLYSTTTNLNLARYAGLHITVTGEEGLDSRWQDTPVLTIQKIYVLSKQDAGSAPASDKSKQSHPWYHLWLW